MNFASWPFWRVLVVSAIWILLAVVYRALEVFFALRQIYDGELPYQGEGAGVAAVSIGFGAEWVIILIAPIFFIFAWAVAQLIRSGRGPDNSRLQ